MQIRAECPSRRLELTTKGGKERVRRQFFPFELIMAGSAARRAVEPFVQHFSDEHSRAGWRLPPREALFLRLATPTRPNFSRAGAAFVGVPLPATPYSFVTPRQHGLDSPGRTPPLLAPPSPLRLIPPPRHANMGRLFPGGRRPGWRLPSRYALFLRLATPTRSHFSRAGAAFVGVPLPATPYSFVTPRQHGLDSPGRAPPLLAPPSPLRLIPPPRHANAAREFSDTAGNFLTNWRIGILGNKKSGIVPTTIPQVFVKRSLFRKYSRSASYS